MISFKVIIGIFIILAVLSFIVRLPRFRGRLGEKKVAMRLSRLPDEYTVFNDVYLQEGGRRSQIDHVVLSPYGIFVIETKNYSGWIYGGELAPYWTQNIYGHKYRLYNPTKQNDAHARVLQRLLGLSPDVFFPIVVFTGGATIKGDYVHPVLYGRQLRKYILSRSRVLLDEETLRDAIGKLSYSSFETTDTRKEHVRKTKDYVARKKETGKERIREGRCPECGGELVLRNGRYGKFWGCSNYPDCHYTKRA